MRPATPPHRSPKTMPSPVHVVKAGAGRDFPRAIGVLAPPVVRTGPRVPPQPIDQPPDLCHLHVRHALFKRTACRVSAQLRLPVSVPMGQFAAMATNALQ
jgi:hypothetical protein